MAPVKIKLRCLGRVEKELIVNSLIKFHVKFSRILDNNDGYTVFCNDYGDSDNLFRTDCVRTLKALNCQPVLPHEIAVNKCVIVRYLDCSVYDRGDEEIRGEIESENGVRIVDFFKFPNAKSLKLTFLTLEMASRVINKGLKMFHYSVPPSNVERDIFIKLDTCFKCYEVDSHLIAECPKAADYKICSECSSTEHTFKFCKAGSKKCINCNGIHSTLAFRCPYRKAAERNRRANKGKNFTYVSATKQNIPIDSLYSSDLTASLIRANMCIMIAGMEDNISPGTFQKTLDSLLSANGLPSFSLGKVKPPRLSSGNFNIADVERKSTVQSAEISDAAIAINDGNKIQQRQSGASVKTKLRSSEREVTTPEEEKIRIIKRKGTKTVNRQNLKKLANKGNVIVICNGVTELEGIDFLTDMDPSDNKVYFRDIEELPDEEFNEMLLRTTRQ